MNKHKQEIKAPIINPVQRATTPGYRHHKVVPMLILHEDKELYLPMVILTGREMAEVESKSFEDTLKLFKGKSPKNDEPSNWKQQLDAQRAYWTIFYSIRLPGDLTKKWFLSKEQIEDTYNWDEAGILMNNYLTVRLTQPHLINLNQDDDNAFQSAINTIKNLGTESDFFLNGFTTHSANLLIKYLVAQLEILQKNNGSSGTL